MQQYLTIGAFLTAFATLTLGLFVYLYNPRNRLNIVFGLMNLCFFGWGLFLGITFSLGIRCPLWNNHLCNFFLLGSAFYVHLMVFAGR